MEALLEDVKNVEEVWKKLLEVNFFLFKHIHHCLPQRHLGLSSGLTHKTNRHKQHTKLQQLN